MQIKLFRLLAILVVMIFPLSCAASNQERTCQYNPDSGKPNPLGMRSFITVKEKEGNTIFTYEQFPSPVGKGEEVTITTKRELTFYGKNIDTARVVLLQNKNYYSELVGYEDAEGFAPVNEVLTCN
ncbi:MAG TPA: hypothetical protein DDZ80_31275 [Cyanobacteria bacterium UBA8803]|nr:hypothetical protein [Cyanobacteria bacterium UBA9273]HBL62695.1 hypothetical protein [Cyanobacteria bacterium UBA8803]